jgi:pSer/pThr/pTyr-binding forkhead associated (FHA) protein
LRITDLGSRNGTFVDGRRISGETAVPSGGLLRVGGALLVATSDLGPFSATESASVTGW